MNYHHLSLSDNLISLISEPFWTKIFLLNPLSLLSNINISISNHIFHYYCLYKEPARGFGCDKLVLYGTRELRGIFCVSLHKAPKAPLCHKDTAEGKLCLYGIRDCRRLHTYQIRKLQESLTFNCLSPASHGNEI